jgi:carbamoyl-phosphate synthase large subunit
MSACRRLEERVGEASRAVTINHPQLRVTVTLFVDFLPDAFGQVLVDDQTGSLTFIRLNPHLGQGYPLSWQAGARFP